MQLKNLKNKNKINQTKHIEIYTKFVKTMVKYPQSIFDESFGYLNLYKKLNGENEVNGNFVLYKSSQAKFVWFNPSTKECKEYYPNNKQNTKTIVQQKPEIIQLNSAVKRRWKEFRKKSFSNSSIFVHSCLNPHKTRLSGALEAKELLKPT